MFWPVRSDILTISLWSNQSTADWLQFPELSNVSLGGRGEVSFAPSLSRRRLSQSEAVQFKAISRPQGCRLELSVHKDKASIQRPNFDTTTNSIYQHPQSIHTSRDSLNTLHTQNRHRKPTSKWLLQAPAARRTARAASVPVKPNAPAAPSLLFTAHVARPKPRTLWKDPAALAVLAQSVLAIVIVLRLRTQLLLETYVRVVPAPQTPVPAKRQLTADSSPPRPTSPPRPKLDLQLLSFLAQGRR